MNGDTFGMQWMRRDRLKSSPHDLIIDGQHESSKLLHGTEGDEHQADFLSNSGDDVQYLVSDAADEHVDIDQIAAENLIFMARDGQMMTEIISTNDDCGTVVVSANDGSPIDCAAVMRQIASSMLSSDQQDAGGSGTSIDGENYTQDYNDSTPQMVTEEVITDDWVQHQGEERVEISADQIIGSNSQVLLDMEIPLPTTQDEYSALRPFPCDFCSRRFRKKSTLQNHMVAHQSDRSVLCRLCGLRFIRRSELIDHLKSHADLPDPEFDGPPNEIFNEQDGSPPPEHTDQHISFYNRQQHDWYEEAHNHNTYAVSSNNVPIMENNNNSNSNTLRTGRGRISRLKPREDSFASHHSLPKSANSSSSSNNSNNEFHNKSRGVKEESDDADCLTENNKVYPVIDSSKPFVCQQCGLAFARQKALLSHVKTHRTESPFECKQCGDIFWDMNELQDHQRSHQFEESNSEYEPEQEAEETHTDSEADHLYGEFYCAQCGIAFHRQDLLQRHAKTHAKGKAENHNELTPSPSDIKSNKLTKNTKNRPCSDEGGENSSGPVELVAFADMYARYPPFNCVLCGEIFTEEHAIKRHLQNQHRHEMTPNSCILCGKECRDRRALIKHAWDHSREKCHSCSKCGKNFHNKARLKRHMASHRDKTVTCDVCHEEFPDGRTLSNHRHSHSTTSAGKLFPCHECGKTFGSRSSQQIHVRIHTGERPYGCHYCWKAFADGGTLRKHERIHTGEKPYACSVCPRAFNQRVVLREHIRSHHARIDTKRGTYYCTACNTELPSSADLLQHLIQHSDTITAMQRQPVTGPRKYKRRRKLKPHELEKFRCDEGKDCENVNNSDLDMSDFDMEQVDELLDITVSSGTNTSNSNNNNNNHNNNEKLAKDKKSKPTVTRANNKRNNNKTKDVATTTTKTINNIESNMLHGNNSSSSSHLDVMNLMNNVSGKKQRLDSTTSNSSDKLWPSSSSLLSNVENTLQTIETLVVNNNKKKTISTNERVVAIERKTRSTKTFKCDTNMDNTRNVRKRGNKNVDNKNITVSSRPLMIHTEKGTTDSHSKRRGKMVVTRSIDTIKINPSVSNIIATTTTLTTSINDYEIMSPAAQPPTQISSHNNMSIKEVQGNRTSSNCRADLYDAQLLLEASSLRKEHYEKYNPSLVNDLEEILRSPHKSEQRLRFTSESSATHFLAEQSEEEQSHMIKIEPTSPDLRELITGSSCSGTVGGSTHTPTPPSTPQGLGRSLRHMTRQMTANRKYLDFETVLAPASPEKSNSQHRHSNNNNINNNNKTTSTSRSAYLIDYGSSGFDNAASATSSSGADVTAAATAAAVAAEAAVSSAAPLERKTRYFECEMCSSVFTDRALLLEHVNIHI